MTNTPLNPDDEARLKKALEQSANGQVVIRGSFAQYAQTPLNPDELAQLIMWKELPFGGNPDNYIKLDSNSAHKVIELLKPHLAVAQPVVNSVEELDALPVGSIIVPLAYDEPTVLLRDLFGTWAVAGLPEPYDTKKIYRSLRGKGARIVYVPEVKP